MNYMTVRRPVTVSNGLNTLGSFDKLFDSVFGNVPGWDARKPAVDIRADEHTYTIDADLPGLTEEQIDVRVEENLLVISTVDQNERSAHESNGDGSNGSHGDRADGYILRERRTTGFHRSFSLPKDADAAKIEASYRNGVLTVVLPKKPEAKPRQIKINRG